NPVLQVTYLDQTQTEADGGFAFRYKLDTPIEGVYDISVGGESVTEQVYAALNYSGKPVSIPPEFSVAYSADEALSESLGNQPALKPGTYYLKVSADKPLKQAPTVSIDAEGSANDVTDATTNATEGSDYYLERTITFDEAATGHTQEIITISGTSE